jgi:hypothetical protein
MPKTAAAVTGAVAEATGTSLGVAEATGTSLGVSVDPISPLLQQVRRHPGHKGVLAIDPGTVHVGMAAGRALAPFEDGKVPDGGDDELDIAFEIGYVDGLFVVDTTLSAGWVDLLVIEDWRLYEDKIQSLIGSKCETARFIGAVEHLVRKHNRWANEVGGGVVELYEQPAHLQDTTKSYLRKFGIDRTSAPGQGHALSAELHWWYCILQQRGLLENASNFKIE